MAIADVTLRNSWRHVRAAESALLEACDSLTRALSRLEQVRSQAKTNLQQLDHIEMAINRDLEDPTKRGRALRGKAKVAQKRAAILNGMRKIEANFSRAWGNFRRQVHDYQIKRAKIAEVDREYSEHGQGQECAGGTSLLGTLGQIVFACRVSNAFDDLARISGRRG